MRMAWMRFGTVTSPCCWLHAHLCISKAFACALPLLTRCLLRFVVCALMTAGQLVPSVSTQRCFIKPLLLDAQWYVATRRL